MSVVTIAMAIKNNTVRSVAAKKASRVRSRSSGARRKSPPSGAKSRSRAVARRSRSRPRSSRASCKTGRSRSRSVTGRRANARYTVQHLLLLDYADHGCPTCFLPLKNFTAVKFMLAQSCTTLDPTRGSGRVGSENLQERAGRVGSTSARG